ncbi:hypothetical protein [Streptomyces sp. NPDC047869]|uniref:hypothetical protein n=1 Tax=Streptomyces sp. NPDC047869 TaxID=3154709 RepID=UPI003453180E
MDGNGTCIAEPRHFAADFLTRLQADHGVPVSAIVMADAQGFEAQQEPVGKRITARMALLDDPDGSVAGRRPA